MNIVLVHGAFVDGSTWRVVYDLLVDEGHRVVVVQTPNLSLSGDVEATRRVLDSLVGSVVLVGHSCGGAVITEAGNHDSVSALVYIAAFVPDEASRSSPSAVTQAYRAHRSSRSQVDSFCRTARSSTVPSVRTYPPPTPRSWQIRRSHGRQRP